MTLNRESDFVKTQLRDTAGCRHANCPEMKLSPAGHTTWLTFPLLQLALCALLLAANSARAALHYLGDRLDLPVAPAGLTRQLDTHPQTAVAWKWSWIRRPATSMAELSDVNVRNPTFMPGVADLFVFRLRVTDAAGAISIRTLELTAVPADVAVLASPQRLADGSFQLTLIGQTSQSYTVQVSANLTTWADWTDVTPPSFSTPLTDPAAARNPQRFYRVLEAN